MTPDEIREAVAIMRKIVVGEFFSLLDSDIQDKQKCVICGEEAYIAWDYDDDGGRFADLEFCEIAHKDDCPIGRAHTLIASMDKDAATGGR